MPHISEGLLHAHLDGALGPDEQLQWSAAEKHLEVCEDCRERLEEARAVRAAARDLLAGAATPAEPGPGFEALAAEAERRKAAAESGQGSATKPRSGRTAPWWRSTVRLAWAASLVMAAGAGWLGRELMIEEGIRQSGPVAVSEPSERSERTAPGVAEDAVPPPMEDEARDLADEAAPREDADANAAGAREGGDAGEGEPLEQERRRPSEDAPEAAAEAEAPPPEPMAAGEAAPADRAAADGAEERAQDELDDVRIQGQALQAEPEPRCFGPADGDGDAIGELPGPGGELRLEAEGTLRLRAGPSILVGYWEPLPSDSVRLRVTDGSRWFDMRLDETAEGLEGTSGEGGAVAFRSADCPAR